MVRIILVIMLAVFSFSTSAEAGWLENKLKQAAETVGDRIIKDTSDSAYEGAKDAVTPGKNEANNDTPDQYEPKENAQFNEQVEESWEYEDKYSDESHFEEMDEPSWAEMNYGEKPKKKKRTGPPRTDLHLTTDMIISDPESSPEPFKGKIYVDGAKSRTEFDYSGENSMGVIVTGINPTDKVYVLMHSNKQYMESTYDETDSFVFESGKPCEGYRTADNLGKTKLNDRSVTKWRCADPEDPDDYEEAERIITLWVDDKLEIPIRLEEGKGKGYQELRNIREGKPSGDLFKIPAGYKKLAVGAIPSATSLADKDEKLIKNAGIPLYSKARFVYGNSSVGYRFASSQPIERVRTWYINKLPSWPVYEDEFGSWIIYKGKPGAGMGELIMQKTQVSVQKNDKLPEWHSLDKKMTTEILIMVIQ